MYSNDDAEKEDAEKEEDKKQGGDEKHTIGGTSKAVKTGGGERKVR